MYCMSNGDKLSSVTTVPKDVKTALAELEIG